MMKPCSEMSVERVTCHRRYINDAAALFAVFFAHVLQRQVGSLYHGRLQRHKITMIRLLTGRCTCTGNETDCGECGNLIITSGFFLMTSVSIHSFINSN